MSYTLDQAAVLAVQDALRSHLEASGYFDRVAGHTPKNPPGTGLTASITLQRIGFVAARSGLASTTVRLEWRVELFSPMDTGELDRLDPELTAATVAFMAVVTADLTLGGRCDEVPLLGAYGGPGLQSDPHRYATVDGQQFRLVPITVPTIHDDILTQSRS